MAAGQIEVVGDVRSATRGRAVLIATSNSAKFGAASPTYLCERFRTSSRQFGDYAAKLIGTREGCPSDREATRTASYQGRRAC